MTPKAGQMHAQGTARSEDRIVSQACRSLRRIELGGPSWYGDRTRIALSCASAWLSASRAAGGTR